MTECEKCGALNFGRACGKCKKLEPLKWNYPNQQKERTMSREEKLISIAASNGSHVCVYDETPGQGVYLFEPVVCWGLTQEGKIVPIVCDAGDWTLTSEGDGGMGAANFVGVWPSKESFVSEKGAVLDDDGEAARTTG